MEVAPPSSIRWRERVEGGAWGPRFSCSVEEDPPWRSTICPAHFNDTDRSLGFWVVSLVTWVPPHCSFPGKYPVCHLPVSLSFPRVLSDEILNTSSHRHCASWDLLVFVVSPLRILGARGGAVKPPREGRSHPAARGSAPRSGRGHGQAPRAAGQSERSSGSSASRRAGGGGRETQDRT